MIINHQVASYGVLSSRTCDDEVDLACEEVDMLGYTVLTDFVTRALCLELRDRGMELLQRASDPDDVDVVRAPWHLERRFAEVVTNPRLTDLLDRLLVGRYILNQQNLVRNPAGQRTYSQARFHRDLPYQHFVASRPLALNALLCIDDFSVTNGATLIVPGSHGGASFPSPEFVSRHTKSLEAPAGSLIVMHAMLYHAGGENVSVSDRLGLNHVFTGPLFRTQVNHRNLVERIDQGRYSPGFLSMLGLEWAD